MTNCFEVLKLPATATQTEIKIRWRELCRVHHPDRGGNAVDFDTYRRAYNEAMEKAADPLRCPDCQGVGKKVVQQGFTIMRTMCKTCSGKGHVPRV